MEKKSTKIAYFVALGVFVVLLVILGIAFKGVPAPEVMDDGELVQTATPFAGCKIHDHDLFAVLNIGKFCSIG